MAGANSSLRRRLETLWALDPLGLRACQFDPIKGIDNRQGRTESERFRRFGCADIAKRDKFNLDITWLKDASATDPDSLPPPAEVAAEIVESLKLTLQKFTSVAAKLGATG